MVKFFDHLHSSTSFQRVRQANRRLICSAATETLQKLVEEPAMDSPKEIFLKDYKMPDYYFDTVICLFNVNKMCRLRTSWSISVAFSFVFWILMELSHQVDLKFLLGEEKTIVSSKITVSPRVEGRL